MADDDVPVTVIVRSLASSPSEEAFLEHVENLRRELYAASIKVIDNIRPNTKGGAEVSAVIDAIVSGGAGMTALCQVIKFWIRQRGDRMITLTVRHRDGSYTTKEVTGHNIEDLTVREILRASAPDGE